MSHSFSSSMDNFAKLMTVITVGLLLFVVTMLLFGDIGAGYFIAPLFILMIVGLLAIQIREVRVNDSGVTVVRRVGETVYPLSTIRSAEWVTYGSLRGSIRLLGNGGMFGWGGLFYHRSIGRYHMNATRRDELVLIQFDDKKLVVSADKAADLADAIQQRLI